MRAEPLQQTVERLARCGYDGIELNGEPDEYDGAEVKDLLEGNGLSCWGAVTLMEHGGRDMLHPDAYVRRGTQTYLEDTVDMLAAAGGEVLCCVPSTIGKLAPLAGVDQEWGWAIEGLRRLGEFAGERNVRIALEPITRFETYFLNRYEQAAQLVQDVGYPNVGFCLDAYHMNQEESDPLQAIRAAGDRLFDFHIADSNRLPAGRGQIDWEPILATLDEISYDGYLTVEVDPPRDHTPLASVPVVDGEYEERFYEEMVAQTSRHLREVAANRAAA
jgi:sugar phosphate isomerase/epimerase